MRTGRLFSIFSYASGIRMPMYDPPLIHESNNRANFKRSESDHEQ